MDQQDYARQFARMADTALVAIVDDPADRDPEAVHAAQRELDRRGIPEHDLAEIRAGRAQDMVERARSKARFAKLGRHAGDAASTLQSTFISPAERPRSELQWLLVLTLPLALVWFLQLPRLTLLPWIFSAQLDPSTALYLLPVMIIPIIIYLLWRKRRVGWGIGAAFTVYSFASALLTANIAFSYSGGDVAFPLFDPPDLSGSIYSALAHGGLAALFQIKRSTELYRVDRTWRLGAIALGLLVILVEASPILF
ncbi:MAG: hypothetical protein H6595_05090 [Flavobacteriales bacterium]|nr:hypothetical protein [Flavobacteriales bacterium]MCB9166838.1 hypothetical protein [Flavobacteriales bacterium]